MIFIINEAGFAGVRAGTQSKIGPFCGLGRGNLKWIEVLDLFRESKILWLIFFIDLKVQSIHYGNDSLRLSINSIL